MADCITGFRIICSIILLFCPALSTWFYVFYITAGISDMIDGAVARKTNTVSEFGAKMDSVADFVLVIVCMVKLPPLLDIPAWLYIWIGVITLIKMFSIVSGFMVRKRLVAVHSVINKATGILLFILPLTIQAIDIRYSGSFVCIVATFAAIQEGHYIRTGRK